MWRASLIDQQVDWAWQTVLDWVFPRTCLRCGCHLTDHPGTFVCEACRRRYLLIREPFCPGCGVPFFGEIRASRACAACLDKPPAFDESRSLFLYRSTGARLVHALKYEQGTFLQSEITRLLLGDPRWKTYLGGNLLVPVPLHPSKRRKRGYNQAEIVVQAIQAAYPATTLGHCLERIRATPSQTFLSREARLKNMKGAFHCRAIPPEGARVILVDDVLTTGATLNAAARALRKAGAKRISAFTLAHG